ncbi:MAG: pyridoxal phosphate-dependent aminotransferase, partial [Acidobacteriota bacterium]
MKPRLSTRAEQSLNSISPVRQIMSYADSNYIRSLGIDAGNLISYAGGWVNHRAPEELRAAYQRIANDPAAFHAAGAYPHTLGNREFKEAVIAFESHVYGMRGLSVDQIAVGVGSTQLARNVFEILLNPGDAVLMLDPSYCNYPTQLTASIPDVRLIQFPVLDPDTWAYTPDERIPALCRVIAEQRPKVVMLISPDNPTGQVLSHAFVSAVRDAVADVGGVLVMDFAYKELVFNDAYPEYFAWGPSDNFVALRSNSKWCRGLGRRLGWIEAPEFIVTAMESAQNSTILAPDMLHQLAMTAYVAAAIDAGTLRTYLAATNVLYQTAAARMMSAIERHLGLPALTPAGVFDPPARQRLPHLIDGVTEAPEIFGESSADVEEVTLE